MFDDLFAKFQEPSPDKFDAYYYDFHTASKDLSQLPSFLQEMIPYPVPGSGTHKFLYLIYQLACRANLVIECGVFEGGVTVPLAMGLKQNGGRQISIDIDLSRPALHEKINRYGIKEIDLVTMNDLNFNLPGGEGKFDIVYLDSLHDYEHVVRQLFLYDTYLKQGGVFILHDIVASAGINLPNSKEDFGYANATEVLDMLKNSDGLRHISQYPPLIPQKNCLFSPIYMAIKTFLAYRPKYQQFKILDWGGMAFILKQ